MEEAIRELNTLVRVDKQTLDQLITYIRNRFTFAEIAELGKQPKRNMEKLVELAISKANSELRWWL